MLEQALQNAIPNQLSIFGKLTEGHDPYHFAAWDKEGNIAILRYWFWNRTKTKQNRKRVFINELEGLLKHSLVSKSISLKDLEILSADIGRWSLWLRCNRQNSSTLSGN